jgi:hypothetical protein
MPRQISDGIPVESVMELQYLPLDLMLHAILKATYLQLTITTPK